MIYGATSDGFVRKAYLDILENMQSIAKELFGDNIDLSEKSPLGMFIQVIAWEISESWEGIENSYFNSFSLYADGIALDRVVGNFGRKRFLGTKATTEISIVGDVGTVIPKGFVVATKDGLLFETIADVTLTGTDLVGVQAIASGINGNVPQNSITEIVNPIAGIESITNPVEAKNGTDIESDSELRLRHLEALREPTTGDNIAQYKLWTREVQGVGAIRVLATTPSAGYVTIIITDIDNDTANTTLINKVKDYIDPIKPINAGLVVETAINKNISITSNIQLAEGYVLASVKDEIESKIKQYFKDISLKETYISYAQIGRIIIETKGVIDYTLLKLNSGIANIPLGLKEVPQLLSLELV